jgi:glutamate carboxypeptidase
MYSSHLAIKPVGWHQLILLVIKFAIHGASISHAFAGVTSTPTNSRFLTDDAIRFLREMIEIPSGSQLIIEQDQLRQRIMDEFKDLPFISRVIGGDKGRKILVFDSLPVAESKPKVVILAHQDTVYGAEKSTITVTKSKISGNGVIDMKGGILAIRLVMSELIQRHGVAAVKNVRIIINDDEEVGSPGSRDVIRELALGAEAILVFEPGLPNGSIITSQSGVEWVKLTVKGVAAHAGLEPEEGASACIELGYKLIEIAKLSEFSKRLTVNPGVISGGTAPNTICSEATATIDIRYRKDKDLDLVMKKIQVIANKQFYQPRNKSRKITSSLTRVVGLPPLPDQSRSVLYTKFKSITAGMGVKIPKSHVGYASDANHLAELNIPILVGLGPVGEGMHSVRESLDVSRFDRRIELSVRLIEKLLSD